VLHVQQGLTELGYPPGPIDGMMREETREAIRAFERDRGLPETGEVSERLLSALATTSTQSAPPQE
jgi:localization factor PodJL